MPTLLQYLLIWRMDTYAYYNRWTVCPNQTLFGNPRSVCADKIKPVSADQHQIRFKLENSMRCRRETQNEKKNWNALTWLRNWSLMWFSSKARFDFETKILFVFENNSAPIRQPMWSSRTPAQFDCKRGPAKCFIYFMSSSRIGFGEMTTKILIKLNLRIVLGSLEQRPDKWY